jgi:hypothetical protein
MLDGERMESAPVTAKATALLPRLSDSTEKRQRCSFAARLFMSRLSHANEILRTS